MAEDIARSPRPPEPAPVRSGPLPGALIPEYAGEAPPMPPRKSCTPSPHNLDHSGRRLIAQPCIGLERAATEAEEMRLRL